MSHTPDLSRRNFMLLRRPGAVEVVELSCERLYMEFMDARRAGTTAAWFSRLARRLRGAFDVRLVDESWLRDPELREWLNALLGNIQPRGGSGTSLHQSVR